MEDCLILKTKDIPFWLEIGLFNLFILVLMLPPTWIQNLSYVCPLWAMCCCRTGEAFFRNNLLRLEVLAIALPLLILAETVLVRVLLSKDSAKGLMLWLDYAARSVFRSLPFLLLIFAAMAIPIVQPLYAAVALLGIWSIFGASGFGVNFSPVSLLRSEGGTTPRLHLKNILIYLFLLVAVVPPLFFSRANACDCDTISSVKANMHTYQTIVETYAVDWGGGYAPTPALLKTEASIPEREYWKDFVNPYTSLSGEGKSYIAMPEKMQALQPPPQTQANLRVPTYSDVMGIRFYGRDVIKRGKAARAGLVLYDYVSPTRYYVYGLDKNGELIQDRGQAFYLTNS